MNYVGTCRICKRRHHNIGHQLSRSHPIKWYCRDCSVFIGINVPKKQFDIYEGESMQAAGIVACQYLDTVEQTDLAELTPEQWQLFFAKYQGAYEDAMKKIFEGLAK